MFIKLLCLAIAPAFRTSIMVLILIGSLGCTDSDREIKEASDEAHHAAGASHSHHDVAQAVPAEAGSSRDFHSGPLSISNVYIREPAPGQHILAGFATFKNEGQQALTLNHVHSADASTIEVHRTQYEEGHMQMRRVNHLVVPPKSELQFQPGGYHLMLRGVEKKLKPGEQMDITFSFEGGVTVNAIATVRAVH